MSHHPHPAGVWPTGGTPLVKEVSSSYFLPVTEEILAEITRRIVAARDPEKVILFGSYAYGTPSADSDVDLLVIAETDADDTRSAVAVSQLIWPRPFPVDILVKTPAEVEAALRRNDFFLQDIVQHGRVLYERPK
jgi:predicted nucleotidyltransferase